MTSSGLQRIATFSEILREEIWFPLTCKSYDIRVNIRIWMIANNRCERNIQNDCVDLTVKKLQILRLQKFLIKDRLVNTTN